LNKKERERYRNKLLKKKDEIVDKISETINESKEVESGIAQDVADKAESSYTKEFLLSLTNTEREQLLLIDEALKRIDKKELGICQRCGKDIIKKRLDAVPWTPHCIDCQKIEEEESS
jgi:DnaK suppressor protein